ncbi:MAG: DnaB-like helicase C-terminal domain-containing protein [Acutalibacteraceae bacterium]
MVDYLQKIKPVRSSRYASDYENVSQISSDLQQLGRQTGIPIIALSQLSRPERGKSGKIPPPTLSSLRSSGQIEQDADVVMLLYREDQDAPNSRRLLRVAKNKEGETTSASS